MDEGCSCSPSWLRPSAKLSFSLASRREHVACAESKRPALAVEHLLGILFGLFGLQLYVTWVLWETPGCSGISRVTILRREATGREHMRSRCHSTVLRLVEDGQGLARWLREHAASNTSPTSSNILLLVLDVRSKLGRM